MYIRRFQSHRGFIVLCFNLLRRGLSLKESNLITSQDHWDTTGPLIESLTEERLTTAAREAANHKPISDVAVKKLLAMVNTIGTKDTGSEERKSHLLARLKSATVYHGLRQIFIMLNPADQVSPIALFYAGEKLANRGRPLRISVVRASEICVPLTPYLSFLSC
jgi:Helitron helicase-like domain at N-terminus